MIVRLSLLCFYFILADAHTTDRGNVKDVPYLELAEPEDGYHGLVKENETLVELTPTIKARGPLCSFLILNNKHHGEAPFEIMVVGNNEARLRVRFPLDCEKRRNYKFDIAAVGCDGSYSNTVPVHITVSDVNEYAPVFTEDAYVRSVDEGRLYDEVVRVEATDRDCTPHFSDICRYEIEMDRGQPFSIDNDGVIRNTEPLDYEKSHNHILTVVAYDCGMKRSLPVMVTIKVNKPCKAGWKDVAERVDYVPGSGPVALFPSGSLQLCSSTMTCSGVRRISAAVTLQASRAGSGCDRDTYAVHRQKTLCGLDPKTVDLLPGPGAEQTWDNALKPDSGLEEEQMFYLDGSTSSIVPASVLPHLLSGTFSIVTWMRHADNNDSDKHRKEHIMCLADDHKMNRHHYALFVRNCRLIFLLRRDFGEGDLNIFRPAEWRWKIPEVCDNEWHHYALNVRFPSVELLVDGLVVSPPEVIDDWPLHPAKDINTTLSVGACWQGTESDMKHHLTGWLAGLGISTHTSQSKDAIKCIARCKEGLSLVPDLYLKSVSVEGDSASEVETLLRKVSYGDARQAPTPGRRNLHLATTLTCDNGNVIKARPSESYIMVLQPQLPSVVVSGSGEANQDYQHFREGVQVFADVQINVQKDDKVQTTGGRLDSCVVSVYPALNPDHESLKLRQTDGLSLLDEYDITAALTRDGLILSGADSQENYQEVLRTLEYTNKKPAYYLNRVFKLTCSEMNGRFTSNEFVQTLTVVHPHSSPEPTNKHHQTGVADKLDHQRDNEISAPIVVPRAYISHAVKDKLHSAEEPNWTEGHHSEGANMSALVMCVVAVGVVGVAVGVAWRLRWPRPSATPSHDLHWDDDALTITVNPMEQQNGGGGECGVPIEGESDSDCSSDSDEEHHDSDDEDHVISNKQHKYKNVSQLEWDNSTM